MLVGLLGQAQSGKDSVGNFLVEKYGFHRASFAASLKQICIVLFNLTSEQLNTKEGKETIDPRYDLTPRTILQRVGVGMREIYPNIWIDLMFNGLEASQKDSVLKNSKYFKDIVVTDVRFLNEVKAIKERGGYVIRLVREDHQALQGREAQHASETEQLSIPKDLINLTVSAKTGELEKLYREVSRFLEGIGLCY